MLFPAEATPLDQPDSLYAAPVAEPRRRSPWLLAFRLLLVLLLMGAAGLAGVALALLGQFSGETNLGQLLTSRLPQTVQAIQDPRQFFPGRHRLTVLCMGLDRNIIISRDPRINGMPSTKNARTDVMMVVSLDLESGTVGIVSIPRDTRVRLPGRESYSKINEAHSRGGIPYTIRAVEEFLNVPIDYHVVIKQEAIEEVVNALGGLRLDVEKDMDYDDNWGQLHIHLRAGEQVLDGQQVVGYMRFRHDREGDFGRIRRQQQVIHSLAEAVKSPSVLLKASQLIEAVRKNVQTDLTPEQQLALAHLFHRLETGNITTVSLPVAGTPSIGGIDYVEVDERKKSAVVEWILGGNPDAMNRLLTVELKNQSGSPELYQQVARYLAASGFNVRRAGRAPGEPLAASRVVQRTRMRGSGRQLLRTLGLTGMVETSSEPGYDLTLYVGRDLLERDLTVYLPESLPEPVRGPDPAFPEPVLRERGSPGGEGARVRVRSLDVLAPQQADPPGDEPSGEEPPAGEEREPPPGDEPRDGGGQ